MLSQEKGSGERIEGGCWYLSYLERKITPFVDCLRDSGGVPGTRQPRENGWSWGMKQKAAMNGFDQSNEKETKERFRLGEVNGIQTSRTLVTNIVQFLGLPDGNNVEKKNLYFLH